MYAPSEVDPDDVLNIPDGSEAEASHERLVSATSQHVLSPLRLATWNVAGARAKRVKLLISSELDFDVLALQEHPKQKATGWQLLKGEVFHGLLHQNYLMYRSVMLLYNRKKFHLLGRRASERGIWAKLQHIEQERSCGWGASICLTMRPGMRRNAFCMSSLRRPQEKADTCIVLGDMNTQFRWTVHEGICNPSVVCTRWSDLRQGVAAKGYSQLPPPPHQASAPTFHSRKQNVTNAQIDDAFAKGFKGCLDIQEGSRVEVGSDHDRVAISGTLSGQGVQRPRVRAGGPLRVVREPPPTTDVAADNLTAVAKKCCRPASLGRSFVLAQQLKRFVKWPSMEGMLTRGRRTLLSCRMRRTSGRETE